MDLDFVKQMKDIKDKKDDATTIAEHEAIILHYRQTGYLLDHDDAVRKYKEFNDNHPEYYNPMMTIAIQNGTAVRIDDRNIPDEVIIGNMNQQLFYLTGKNLLEEWQKAEEREV